MKITSIEVWKKNLGNKRPYTIAFKTVDDVDNVFVKINLENGQFGLGNANPSKQVVNESLEESEQVLSNENLDFLIGKDIRNLYVLLQEIVKRFPATPAARAALDIAVYDAYTNYLGIPLGKFLGQQIKTLETSVTIGIKSVADTLEEAEEYWTLGFRCLKVKTGLSVTEDIERMAKLRERFKRDIKIRVDANQGYNEDDMTLFYNKTEDMDIELIEQPVKASEVELMKRLPSKIRKVIAADESLINPTDAFVLASPPAACGIFNIKLMKSGGIYPALQIANIAQAAGINLMWGCNDESAISISAALHAALSCQNTRYIDLDGSLDLLVDVVSGGFVMNDGWMSLSDKPGLGLTFNPEGELKTT